MAVWFKYFWSKWYCLWYLKFYSKYERWWFVLSLLL